jgi:ribosome maturation factor RimP
MKENELKQFLNKYVKLNFNVGYNHNYIYSGEVININSDTLTILDQKIGKTLLANERIVQISEINNGGSNEF